MCNSSVCVHTHSKYISGKPSEMAAARRRWDSKTCCVQSRQFVFCVDVWQMPQSYARFCCVYMYTHYASPRLMCVCVACMRIFRCCAAAAAVALALSPSLSAAREQDFLRHSPLPGLDEENDDGFGKRAAVAVGVGTGPPGNYACFNV